MRHPERPSVHAVAPGAAKNAIVSQLTAYMIDTAMLPKTDKDAKPQRHP